jgi:UDP-N-acetylglucosamine--N-acetylmuramyl-(pentapeptide) pyrophosphoryl-undecaprenol N-acetylglucosamine transferase
MKKPIRIVCYAINGAGMGHVTRLLGVARWMRRLIAFVEGVQPEILFLTSSDASDMLADARFAAFKIPSKTVARSAGLEKLEYRRLAKHFIWQTIGVFSPDLLVVDTFPSGSFDELFQILDGPFKKSFIHRNVKSDYASRPTFRVAMSFYDAVVIPHRAPALETSDHGDQLGAIPHRYTGEVVQFDREQLPDRQTVRRELRISDSTRLIYVSAGGGGDPQAEESLRKIIGLLETKPDCHLIVGAGPLYRGQRFMGPSITWCETSSIWRYFPGCDAAVSAGGYNTFHELLFAGVPSLFYAQEKIADDQWLRVKSAEDCGACLTIPSLDDDSELEKAVEQLLQPHTAGTLKESCGRFIERNGALECAVELIRPLFLSQRLESAIRILKPSIAHRLELLADGDLEAVTQWLGSVYPQARVQQLVESNGLESVLHLLSNSAAEELRSVIQRSHGAINAQSHELALQEILDLIGQDRSKAEARQISDEVFRCVAAITKRYPHLTGSTGEDWIQWSTTLLHSLKRLMLYPVPWPVEDTLSLFRVFPRMEDVANIHELSDTFIAYLRARMQGGDQFHDVLRHLQLLKMTRPVVSRSSLELSEESVP